MNYIISILVLFIFIGLYVVIYLSNSKIKKPKCSKDIECNGCNLNCNKRSQ
jgi:hypothetical protein